MLKNILKINDFIVWKNEKPFYICTRNNALSVVIGELAEWSNAAVLKTVEGHTSGGSNPSLSANPLSVFGRGFFYDFNILLI